MSKRYQFPMPYGWFQVSYSYDLQVGQSRAIHYFGQELVIFRGEDGRAQVLDAYCPHQGAHLGHGLHNAEGGGTVEGNNIVCPFHGWKFSRDGRVAEIPYAKNIPPRAKDKECIKSWPTIEKNQVIWVWYHPENIAPLWEVESLREADDVSAGWNKIDPKKTRHWTINTVAQEIAENAVDYAHFISVHQVKSDPSAETHYDAHSSSRVVKVDMQTPRGTIEGTIASESRGPGQNWVRFSGITETLLFGNVTPVDEEVVEVNFSFFQPLVNGEEPEGGVHAAIVADICRQLDEDNVIWQNKVYRENPILCDGDGPIAKFRRYYAQFYVDTIAKAS